jgi:hypothetical protein
MVDGDDTYPAECAPALTAPILEKQADMVVGDRLSSTYFTENKRPFHNFGNSLVRWAINTIFKSEIKDVMTGYRAFNYQFVKSFPVLSKGFEIETEMTIHAVSNNMDVRNVIVEYRDRPAGSVSKLSTYSDGIKVIGTIIKLHKNYKPFAFFNTIAVLLTLLALGFFIPVFIDYIKTGLVERFPTLITCGFVLVIAIQSFFAGVILSTMAAKNRRDFEQTLINIELIRNR